MENATRIRKKAKELGAPSAEDLIANVPSLRKLLAPQHVAEFQRIIDASFLNPMYEKQFRDAMEASVTARSGELIMYDEAKVRNAHEIRDRKIRVSKSDGHIRLDHHKMLTADALTPRSNNPDEAEYLQKVRSVLNSLGVWLRIEQPWHLKGSNPAIWKFWFSLGRDGDTIKTNDAIIDREELLGTAMLGYGYYKSVLTGHVQAKLDRAFERFDTAYHDGFMLHLDIMHTRSATPFVATVSDCFGGADFPPRSIWDKPAKLRRIARAANKGGDVEKARHYLVAAAHIAEYNAELLNIYLEDTIKGGERAELALLITVAFASIAETALYLTGAGFGTKAARAGSGAKLSKSARHELAERFRRSWGKKNNISEAELKPMRVTPQGPATKLGNRKGGHSAGGGTGFHKFP